MRRTILILYEIFTYNTAIRQPRAMMIYGTILSGSERVPERWIPYPFEVHIDYTQSNDALFPALEPSTMSCSLSSKYQTLAYISYLPAPPRLSIGLQRNGGALGYEGFSETDFFSFLTLPRTGSNIALHGLKRSYWSRITRQSNDEGRHHHED